MILIKITDKAMCNACHACFNSCPKNCISMLQDDEGFLYPEIDPNKCISCGMCKNVCPVLNGKTYNTDALQVGYVAFNKDEDIRLNSSSGGVFSLLAKYILENAGIVIGAAMSEDCKNVHHTIVESSADLYKLRGSKYLQSTIGDVFKSTKNALDSGKFVLFSGTPCQIGGLYSYLGKSYSNLYTQDLICHGVPSPMIWRKNIEYREKEHGASVRRTFFRHKKYGWKMYSVLLNFSNNTEYLKEISRDAFMQGFLNNVYLRPSCYSCAYKTIYRQADITLADFWGVEKLYPDMDDDKGTSFVWIHSEKGKELFEMIKDQLIYKIADCNRAIVINSAATNSCPKYPKRKEFYEDIQKLDFEYAIKKHTKESCYKKMKKLLGRIKRKCMSLVDKT